MKEQEPGEYQSAIEQVRQDLLDQLMDSEFGSAKFQAASDFFDLSEQHHLLSIERRNVLSAENDPEKRISWESELRIREAHIAILEREIDRNQSRIPGYSKAYIDLDSSFDRLANLIWVEAESRYPADEESMKKYGIGIYEKIRDEIRERIYTLQEQS